MALDSGLTVFVCSIFFVFLALLKQNVLIFVPNNLGNHSSDNPSNYALFCAYDLDYNGVIDSDEFDLIARRLLPPLNSESVVEAELDVVYVDMNFLCSGSKHLPAVDKSVVYPAAVLATFIPSSPALGHKWVLHESARGHPTAYFSHPVRPTKPHYPLYQLLSRVHWNVMFDTRHAPLISSAIVSAVSDSHIRVNFLISVEFQLSEPPEQPVWLEPCQACGVGQGIQLQGEAVITADLQDMSYFVIECGERAGDGTESGDGVIRIGSVGGFYQYKIQNSRLVAVPLGEGEGVSYRWYEEVEDWRDVLNQTQF